MRPLSSSPVRVANAPAVPASPAAVVAGVGRDGVVSWQARLARNIAVTDAAAITVALVSAHLLRFGFGVPHDVARAVLTICLGFVWFVALGSNNSRDPFVIGSGIEEFRRVRNASILPFFLFAAAELWLKADFARIFVMLALLVGFALINVGRYAWRRSLWRHRAAGHSTTRTIVLGADSATIALAESLSHDHHAGMEVVGACIPGYLGAPGATLRLSTTEIPILGDETQLVEAVRATGADVVAVTASEALDSGRLKELTWELDGTDTRLVLAPGLLDIADNRLRVTSTTVGTSLIHVERPQYRKSASVLKTAFDRTAAIALLIFLAPVLVAVAAAVKFTSRGPIFYTADRIGASGIAFPMVKFRSMYVDADKRKTELAAQNEADGPLFKMRDDPRVTAVGKVIRRFSLDELPQLFNVLAGQMSLVGPRPHLEQEVALYTTESERRMLVRPGLTGLWQVSGRSDLSWDESIGLDLYYVENWSILLDMYILAKTLKAVTSSDGAY
ncbi:sugar transferase [Gordonia sp. TBRC 11910]|uniref:Sugar transferase n=1 Tax=Gordonia asplenii TaxID=2725283 RepID=A0A848KW42_9ACTN|nr:sugar transferase [Gordonia asplenii]NMO02886.1 sugar transferase [Gordonia asplenii]